MKYRYRESHEMKDSGVEWLGMIPKEWEVKAHKYIMYKKKEICNVYSKENILSLTKKGVIVRDLENPSGKMPTTFDGYQKVYKNNLLLCLFDIDVTPRCVGVIKENGLTSPAYSQFIVKNGNVNYYNYLLNKIDDEKSFLHLSKNLRNSLTEENFGIIKTIKPKVLEQQKIADFLDKKCEEFDSVIAKKEMLINKLEEAKKSLISEVVTGKVKVIQKENGEYGIIKREAHEMKDSGVEWLGVIPKEWQVSKLKYFANINPKKKEGLSLNEIVSFVPMESVKLGTITLNYTKKISEVINGYTYFENNDILLAKVTPCFENRNIGICENLINGIGFGSTELNAIRAKNNKDIKYLYYFLQEESFIKKGASTMTGTGGLKRIPTEFLYNCPIPYCKKDEKIKMTGFLDKKCSQFTIAIEKQKESIEKLKSAKQSLISEAITGKIEVL